MKKDFFPILARSFAVFALALTHPPVATAQDEAHTTEKVAGKLKVLDRYVGEWDVAMGIADNEQAEAQEKHTGTAVAEWILDSRFVEQTSTVMDSEGKTVGIVRVIMTYDVEKEMYRSWWFVSAGLMMECLGTWDDGTETMHWISEVSPRGIVHTIDAKFPKDGVEEWTINVRRANGKMSAQGRGTNTRRKKE